jgi:DNA-3-methyladenine glycosylase I
MNRCGWADDDLSIRYHDEEGGVPAHENSRWFEVSPYCGPRTFLVN